MSRLYTKSGRSILRMGQNAAPKRSAAAGTSHAPTFEEVVVAVPKVLTLRMGDYSKYFVLGSAEDRMRANWDQLGHRFSKSFVKVNGQLTGDQQAAVREHVALLKNSMAKGNPVLVREPVSSEGKKGSGDQRKTPGATRLGFKARSA